MHNTIVAYSRTECEKYSIEKGIIKIKKNRDFKGRIKPCAVSRPRSERSCECEIRTYVYSAIKTKFSSAARRTTIKTKAKKKRGKKGFYFT